MCARVKVLAAEDSGIWPLLNDREQFLVTQLDSAYRAQYGAEPEEDMQLFYFLGDRFEFSKTWTAGSHVLPAFRKNPAKYLHRPTLTALTPQEKLTCLGWPTTLATAGAMGTTPLPSLDAEKADKMCGNSMHLTVAAKALFLGLCCFGPRDRRQDHRAGVAGSPASSRATCGALS